LLKNENFKKILITGGTSNLIGFNDVFSKKVHDNTGDYLSKITNKSIPDLISDIEIVSLVRNEKVTQYSINSNT